MEEKNNLKKRKKFPVITTIAVVIAIVFVSAFFQLTSASYISAQLHIESGDVLINGKRVSENKELKQNDVIETLNGIASIILYESIVINLDINTRVIISDLIKKHPKLKQENGKTWNTFTKLAGIEDYSIKEGNNVASVRGTTFGFSKDKIIGAEGESSYATDSRIFNVKPLRVIEKIGYEFKERAATPQEIQEIKLQLSKSIEELKYLREKEIEDHPILTNLVLKTVKIREIQNGGVISERTLTNDELDEYLAKADRGEIDVDGLVEQSPIDITYLEKVVEFTKAIKKLQEELTHLG